MKNNTKWIASVVTAVAVFFAVNVKAQTAPANPWRLGIGLEAGIPTGNANNISNFELGGTLRLQYDATTNFAVTLTSGYYNMFGKEIPGTNVHYNSLGLVPVKLGIKDFFSSNFYFGAEAGAAFETNGYKDTKLDLSPTLGWANKTWDVAARYENFSGQSNNYGLVGLRIAYAFGL